MPVQTISLTPITTGIGHIRPFSTSRIKLITPSFLRHGYMLSIYQLNDAKEHNALQLACRLPEEILWKIFVSCAQSTLTDADNSWSWVNVTYICSSWRRAAIDCQDLWPYIDFSHPKWHALTSQRAKTSALHVITNVTKNNTRLLHRTLQLAHRIKDIHLKSSVQHIHPLLEILTHPNPALESLSVDIQFPKHISYMVGYDPPAFPTGGPPLTNLKYMELRNAPFYLLTSRCIYLTHLLLYDLPMTERPPPHYFLFMLEQLTRLQVLTLERAFPINMEADDPKLGRPVALPQLRTITLAGTVPEIANILECITIPSYTRLIGRIYSVCDLKSNIWKLTEALGLHSWSEGVLALETLVLSGYQSAPRFVERLQQNRYFKQSLRIRGFGGDREHNHAAIDITISPEESSPNDHEIIIALCAIWKALFLTQVHTLVLQDVDVVTQKTWSRILRSLPSLRVLDITGRAPSGLAWALLLNARSLRQNRKRSGGSHNLLVPELNDLYLHNVDCSAGGFMVAMNMPVNSHHDLDDSRFLDVLFASLSTRGESGLCLRSLSIAKCEQVLRRNLDEARRLVSHLVCDISHVSKDEDVDKDYPASYWEGYDMKSTELRHYHRLRTLKRLDFEVS